MEKWLIEITHNASFKFRDSSMSVTAIEKYKATDDEFDDADIIDNQVPGMECGKLKELIDKKAAEKRQYFAKQIEAGAAIEFGNSVINAALLNGVTMQSSVGMVTKLDLRV